MNDQFQSSAVPDKNRNFAVDNSAHRYLSGNPEPPLPTLNLPNFSQEREEDGEGKTDVEPAGTTDVTLKNASAAPNAPVQRK